MLPQTLTAAAPCAVLDSNVWIDILVFDDAATRPIRTALEDGTVTAVTDARCFGELAHVLDYPQFARFAIDKDAALATLLRLARHASPPECGLPALPQCRDRDDQKFVELAWASGAHWLVSKDRALLKLGRRTAREFGFQIGLPAAFVAACGLDRRHGEATNTAADTGNAPDTLTEALA